LTKVTISDIARLSKFSEATVSRVLNKKQNVSASTRQIVLDIVDQVGYVHTLRTPSEDPKLKNIALCIGLFDTEINLATLLANGYYSEIVEGIQAECQSLNINLMLMTIGPDIDTVFDVERAVENGDVDAILLVRVMNPDAIECILGFGIPVALLGNYFPWIEIDSINSDSFSGMLLAMQHLIDNGHRQIAFIDGNPPPFNDYWVVVRKLAYQHMLEQYQIPFDSELVAFSNLQVKGGRQAMEKILATGRPITAVLASNDLAAIGASQAIRSAKLRIPDDISLIGHDDNQAQFNTIFELTTVFVAKRNMGHIALQLLQARIRNPDRPIQHILTAESLIQRHTVRNLNGDKLKSVNPKIMPYWR
jgi:LacI family transcriptional regulator